jgi:hypothetical protein
MAAMELDDNDDLTDQSLQPDKIAPVLHLGDAQHHQALKFDRHRR